MTRLAFSLFALCAACTPNLTTEFVGEWSLSSGQKSENCGPGLQKTSPLAAGTLELTASSTGPDSVRLVWRAFNAGTLQGSCEMTGTATETTRLQLRSRSCSFGSPFSIIDGEITLTESRALNLLWQADVPAGSGTCRQTWDALFVRK